MQTKLCNSCGNPVPMGTNICPFCGCVLGITLDDDITVVNEKEKPNKQTDTLKFNQNDRSYNDERERQTVNSQRLRSLDYRQPRPTGIRLPEPFIKDEEKPNYNPATVHFQNNNSVSRPPKKKNTSNVLWVIFAILFTATAFILFGLYINNEKDKELEVEREKAKKNEMELAKLQKEAREAKLLSDSILMETRAKRYEDSIRMVQEKKAEQQKKQQIVEPPQNQVVVRDILNGSFYLSGTVKNKVNGDRYWFKLWLEIEDGDVSGSFKTSANEGPVNGHVDSSGNMTVYELDYDYDATGYYWSGKFNGKTYSGNYYSDWGDGVMSFWTNK